VLAKLIKPSEGLATTMKQLGYESGTAMVEALGFRGSLLAIAEASGGTAEGLSKNFDDINALRGALALTNNEGEKWTEIGGLMEDSSARAGAAQNALAEQSKAAGYQLTLLRNQAMAVGVEAANLILPATITGLRELGEMGESAGRGLQQLGEIAGPTLENLASIGEDLWEVFTNIADVAAPLATGLGKLAVGGTVETLELLTDVLAPMVGFLGENEVAAMALAIALGIHLVGGLTGVITRIQVGLVLALYNAIGAMGAATAGTAALRGGLAALASSAAVAGAAVAVATGGLSLILAGVAVGYNRASESADRLKAAQDGLDNAESLNEQVAALARMRTESDAVLDRISELQSREFGLGTLIDVPRNVEAIRLVGGETEKLALQQEKAAISADVFRTNVNRLAESGFAPGSEAANRFHNDVVLSGKAFDDMLPILASAGVQVGDSFEVMSAKVVAYKASTQGASGASDDMVGALDGVASGAKTTEEAVEDLASALDKLMGVFLSQSEAAIAFEAALDDMEEQLASTNGSLDINAEVGRENVSAINAGVQALKDKIEADAAAGETAEALSETLRVGRDRLIEQATAAGLPKKAMEALLAQYNLTPDLVQTIVEAVGAAGAKGAIDDVKAAADRLNGTTATVTTLYRSIGAPGSAPVSRIVGVGGGMRQADGGFISGPGGPREDRIPALLSNGEYVINAAQTTLYRPLLEAINSGTAGFASGGLVGLAAGGSPLPRHATLSGEVSRLAGRGGSVDDIQALTRAWEDYIRALDQAARRRDLVNEVTDARREFDAAKGMEARTRALEGLNRANQQLREFDVAAARDRERAAVDRLIDRLEAEAQAREDAARAAQEQARLVASTQDNMYAVGALTQAQYLVLLDERLAAEERFSDEWTALWRQRQQILDDQADAERDAMNDLVRNADDALGALNQLLDAEQAIRRRMAQAEDRFADARAASAARSVQEQRKFQQQQAALRDRQMAAETVHLDRMRAAAQQLVEAESQALAERRDRLVNATALDQQIAFQRGLPADWLVANARRQIEAFTEWMEQLDLARRMGVSEQVIAALGLEEGPQALAQVRALTRASAEEINALNDAVEQRTRVAGEQVRREQAGNLGQLGQSLLVAQQQYAAAVAGLQATYRSEQERLAAELVQIQQQYSDTQAQIVADLQAAQHDFVAEQIALADELANLGQEQGRSYGEALAEALRSQVPAVRAAAAELRAAMDALADAEAAQLPTTTAPVSSGGSGVLGGPSKRIRNARPLAYPNAKPGTVEYGQIAGGSYIPTKTYDVGGWLQPGYTLAYNGTGRPERVSTAEQTGGAGGRSVHVEINGTTIRETVDLDLLVQRAEFAVSAGSL
jgi:hypothetical protein